MSGCPACEHQRFIIEAGKDSYQCAKCDTVAPPGLVTAPTP